MSALDPQKKFVALQSRRSTTKFTRVRTQAKTSVESRGAMMGQAETQRGSAVQTLVPRMLSRSYQRKARAARANRYPPTAGKAT